MFTNFAIEFSALASPRIELFLQQLERLEGKRLSFTDPDNPFFPYRHQHFDVGLSEKERSNLHRLQELGQCAPHVYSLTVCGFFQLYPFLKPVFDDSQRAQKLELMIATADLAPINRCLYYRRFAALRQQVNPIRFDAIDMDRGTIFTHLHRPDGDTGVAWGTLRNLMFSLGILALCQDYPPSLSDLMALANKPGGLQLTKKEAFYLASRAHVHKLITTAQFNLVVGSLTPGTQDRAALEKIWKQEQQTRIHDLEPIDGYWQAACREIHEMEHDG